MRALRNARARGCGGGGGEVLTWASGYNFPLFLVYPVDMPASGESGGRAVQQFPEVFCPSFQLFLGFCQWVPVLVLH